MPARRAVLPSRVAARLGPALAAACAAAALFVPPAPARAQATLLGSYGGPLGYGADCLPPADDASSAPIDLTPAFSSSLYYYGTTPSVAYVNTNGNVSFGLPLPTFTAASFPAAAAAMIAPYYAGVDASSTGGVCMPSGGPCLDPPENGIWWHLEPGLMAVTWDRVGYDACHDDLRMSFQLLLTAPPACSSPGDFDVKLRYAECAWETGDSAGGSGGFGGLPAQAGFDDGSGSCATGLPGVCAAGHLACAAGGFACLSSVPPALEACDGLDNDCNDAVDDGAPCPGTQICARAVCTAPCTEVPCAPGLLCDASGVCIEPSCAGITCPPAERCQSGACADPCAGVVCPFGDECREGTCFDRCSGATCAGCTLCDDESGTCAGRCEDVLCPAGETCQPDSRCVEAACAAVAPCAAGFHCVAGACVDDCLGATCPAGQACVAGACIRVLPGSDAGVAPSDAGAGPTDAATPLTDGAAATSDAANGGTDAAASLTDAASSATDAGPGGGGSCGCRVIAAGRPWPAGFAVLALATILVLVRGRSVRARAARGRRRLTPRITRPRAQLAGSRADPV